HYKNTPTFYAKDRAAWRWWLEQHHQEESSIWLVIFKKESGIPSIYYPEAVEEALCFGWIDSKPNKRDEQSYYQFFSKRSPKSNWSKVNKDKVTTLIEKGLMQPAGMAMVELAQQNGTWNALEEVENVSLPPDLEACFKQDPTAFVHWEAFPRSAKRGILEWIQNAKKPETRLKRIQETVRLAALNQRANQYRP
ncbi:MAG: YdeI/OmpD-associated family protein, partial [Chitinophagales bacterium]